DPSKRPTATALLEEHWFKTELDGDNHCELIPESEMPPDEEAPAIVEPLKNAPPRKPHEEPRLSQIVEEPASAAASAQEPASRRPSNSQDGDQFATRAAAEDAAAEPPPPEEGRPPPGGQQALEPATAAASAELRPAPA
ncbi:unnamed protein product, partial [Prorocentrum cordatum]